MSVIGTLTDFERRAGRALFSTTFPTHTADGKTEFFPLSWENLPVERYLDDTFAALPARPALGLRAALWMIALSPLFVIGRFATLPSLEREEREKFLVKLSASNVYVIRQLVLAWKAVGGLYFGGLPEVRAVAQLPPPADFGRGKKLPVVAATKGAADVH
jgi:hypothetical protein